MSTTIGENLSNTIYNVKKLIGRGFNDIPKKTSNVPFKVKQGTNNRVHIPINHKNGTKSYYPEEITAMILHKVKKIAQNSLGTTIKSAVITVPSHFHNSERQAIKDSGVIAGLNILRIISEPTAVAISYGLYRNKPQERKIIIFDLGASNLNVSLCVIEDGIVEVLATEGIDIGGDDFDNMLIEHCVQDFLQKTGINIHTNITSIIKLDVECERAKKVLSISHQTTIKIDNLYETKDYNCPITREKFEELCLPLFKQVLLPLESIFNELDISKLEIHDIVLVGGSSRIPKIREMIRDFFNGKEPNCTLDPEEVVVTGAAVQAAILNTLEPYNEILERCLVVDIIPRTIGMEIADGIMRKIFPKFTNFPCKKELSFTTYSDSAVNPRILIYEGEELMAKDNKLLGKYELRGFIPAPRGIPEIIVTIGVDCDGIVYLSGINKVGGYMKPIIVKEEKENLLQEEIERMAKDFENN